MNGTQRTGHGFPTRQEWLAWGFVPCRGNGCRRLVNPTEIRYCSACRAQHRSTKRPRNQNRKRKTNAR